MAWDGLPLQPVSLIASVVGTFCVVVLVMTVNCAAWYWWHDDGKINAECGAVMRADLTHALEIILGFLLAYIAGQNTNQR
jgi:apolipoprotein N-acyltransferase